MFVLADPLSNDITPASRRLICWSASPFENPPFGRLSLPLEHARADARSSSRLGLDLSNQLLLERTWRIALLGSLTDPARKRQGHR